MTSKKIDSPAALDALRDQAKAQIDLRTGPKDVRITVHMGTCGIAAGARDVLVQLAHELGEAQFECVTLRQSGCVGRCDQEPMLTLTDKSGHEFHYGNLDKEKVRQIIQEHAIGGNPIIDYLVKM